MKTVERGAALLDERLPGWEDKIDLERLDLASTCNCVLGQLHRKRGRPGHRNYYAGLNELGITTPSRYGFSVWSGGRFESLTEAWRRLITRRRIA